MLLPGKMTLGCLQEDNPVKFYFRVRPLLIKEEDGCRIVEEAAEVFPSDGYIRIVPDKNEMGYFKTRMRGLGRYCVIDLRRHTGENDKIRQNKNHTGENGDRNAFIVYSDVIVAAPATLAAEAVCPDQDGLFPAPGTKYVAVLQDDSVRGIYAWEEKADSACIVGDNLAAGDLSAAAAALIDLTVDGASVRLLTDLEKWGVAAPKEPEPERAAPERPAPEHPAPEPKPAPAPVPAKAEPSPEAAAPQAPAPQPAPEQNHAEKPAAEKEETRVRMQHTTIVLPRVVTAKYATRRQSLQAQSGYNPRRSASIKDIVDDLWRQSRLDQLGHPVPPESGSEPAVSPVEKAMEAVREAWKLPEARTSMVSALLKLDEMDAALGALGETDAPTERRKNEQERQLSRLESDRLKLLCEIDELKKQRADKRAEMIEELKRTRSEELERIDKRVRALNETYNDLRGKTESARKAADEAGTAFGEALGKDLNERIEREMIDSRVRDMMIAMSATRATYEPVETETMTPGELISAVRVRLGEAGLALSNDDAVNLLACLYLGRVVALSGPTGSGKSTLVRALADALGLRDERLGRYCEMTPEENWPPLGDMIDDTLPTGVTVVRRPLLKNVIERDDDQAFSVLMLDDANRTNVSKWLGAMLSQLDNGAAGRLPTRGGEVCLGGALRVVLTLSDAGLGEAVDSRLLDRTWLIRLQAEPAGTPWAGTKTAMIKPDKAIALASFRAAFDTGRELPAELSERMGLLRRRLGEVGVCLSRRTLNDIHDYCAAVTGMMTCEPIEVLDRAFAQRAMPNILAGAGLQALHALPEIMPDMPRSLGLMAQPLPLPPL